MRSQTKMLLVIIFMAYALTMIAFTLHGQALGIDDSPAYSTERVIFGIQGIALTLGFFSLSSLIMLREL